MPRNLDRRVEVMARSRTPAAQAGARCARDLLARQPAGVGAAVPTAPMCGCTRPTTSPRAARTWHSCTIRGGWVATGRARRRGRAISWTAARRSVCPMAVAWRGPASGRGRGLVPPTAVRRAQIRLLAFVVRTRHEVPSGATTSTGTPMTSSSSCRLRLAAPQLEAHRWPGPPAAPAHAGHRRSTARRGDRRRTRGRGRTHRRSGAGPTASRCARAWHDRAAQRPGACAWERPR
jgi:hypothetical protein